MNPKYEDAGYPQFSDIHEYPNPKQFIRKDNNSFYIKEDTTKYGKYINGGIVKQYKKPNHIKFKSLNNTTSYLNCFPVIIGTLPPNPAIYKLSPNFFIFLCKFSLFFVCKLVNRSFAWFEC